MSIKILQWSYNGQIVDYSYTSDDPHKMKQRYISLLAMIIYPGYYTDTKPPKRLLEATKHLIDYTDITGYKGLKEHLRTHLLFTCIGSYPIGAPMDHIRNIVNTQKTELDQKAQLKKLNQKEQNMNLTSVDLNVYITPKQEIVKNAVLALIAQKLENNDFITESQQEILNELLNLEN